MIQFAAMGLQTSDDTAKAVQKRQLPKSHDQKLLITAKMTNVLIAIISGNTLIKMITGKCPDYLSEEIGFLVHKKYSILR